MVKIAKKCSKPPNMVKIAKNGPNGLKSSKMGQKWSTLPKMAGPTYQAERPKGARDKVKRPGEPPARSRGPEAPLDF